MANKTMNIGQSLTNGVDLTVNGGITQPVITLTNTDLTSKSEKRSGDTENKTYYYPQKWTADTGITPADGQMITIRMPAAGSDYGIFLSLNNGTTYYPIAYTQQNSSRLTTHFPNGSTLYLMYDSNHTCNDVYAVTGASARSNIKGCWVIMNGYNSDTGVSTYNVYTSETTGAIGIFPYTILMRTSDDKLSAIVTSSSNGTSKTKNTNGFMLCQDIYYANNYTVAANTSLTGAWRQIYSYVNRIDFRFSSNCGQTLIGGKPIYLVGTVSNGAFYLDDVWYTQTIPTTDNGKVYIRIGGAYNTYQVDVSEHNPWMWYKDGAFRPYPGMTIYNGASS